MCYKLIFNGLVWFDVADLIALISEIDKIVTLELVDHVISGSVSTKGWQLSDWRYNLLSTKCLYSHTCTVVYYCIHVNNIYSPGLVTVYAHWQLGKLTSLHIPKHFSVYRKSGTPQNSIKLTEQQMPSTHNKYTDRCASLVHQCTTYCTVYSALCKYRHSLTGLMPKCYMLLQHVATVDCSNWTSIGSSLQYIILHYNLQLDAIRTDL